DVAAVVILARGRHDAGLLVGGIEHPDMRVAEMDGEPFGADQRVGMGIGHRRYSAKAMLMRRFCRPLFSILPITTGPISAVLRIWVPPQGCRSIGISRPATSISRTRPAPTGGFTDIVRTSSGRACNSSSVIQSGVTAWAAAIIALSCAAIASLSRLAPGTSKSNRPRPSDT